MSRLTMWMLALGLVASGCSTRMDLDDTGAADDDTGLQDTDTDTDPGTDTDIGTNPDTDIGTDADTGTDTDSGTDADTDSDSGTGAPTDCTDDGNEDDDTFGDATSLGIPGSANGTVCSGDPDWYTVSAGADCLVTVDLSFTQGSDAEDLDLTLFDASEAFLDLSWSTDDDESLTYITDDAEDLYLRINGYEGAENDYALSVSETCWTAPATCPDDDAFEDNDSIAEAHPINLAPTSLDGAVCGDSDYYEIVGGESCVLDATLDIVDESNDLELWLYDSAEELVGGSAGTSDEELLFTFADDPVYYLEVQGFEGDEGAYTLDVAVDCLPDPPTCANGDDLYEDNDTEATAASLNPLDTVLEGAACDDDWYETYLLEGCWLQGYAAFTHADGDLDLELVDTDGLFLDWSESETDDEYLSWIATDDGLVRARVYGYEGATNSYGLTTSVACPDGPPSCPDDDVFEGNDTAVDGAQLNRGLTWIDAALCSGAAPDFYWAIVPGGCTLEVDLEAADTSADLDVYLVDGDGNELASGHGNTGVESVSYTSSDGEIVDVEVTSIGDEGAYTLVSEITCQ